MKMHVPNIRRGYPLICDAVVQTGSEVSPRGMRTKEVLDAVIVADDPRDSLPVGCGRDLVPAIGIVEALQLIAGRSYPELTRRVGPRFGEFMDGGAFHGSYGQRIRGQMSVVLRRLRADRDTRQAVVTLWDPQHDLLVDDSRDYPCTIALQFLIRNDRLQLHAHMRSNDVWLGFPYDAFQFTSLQLAAANALSIEPGPYYHHATSLHAYEHDWERIGDLRIPLDAPVQGYKWSSGIGVGYDSWERVQQVSREILDDTWNEFVCDAELYTDPVIGYKPWPTEDWMSDHLVKYR